MASHSEPFKPALFSLAPSFLCPFGWPAQPTYPIDLHPSQPALSSTSSPSPLPASHPSRRSTIQLVSIDLAWLDIFTNQQYQHMDDLQIELNRIYLEALYLASLHSTKSESPAAKLAERLRSWAGEYDHGELIELYESFLIPEDLLARKWGEEMKKVVASLERSVLSDGDQTVQPEIADEEEMFHHNEAEAIAVVFQHLHLEAASERQDASVGLASTHDLPSSLPATLGPTAKVSFAKSDTTLERLENLSTRETQLQIVLLLEIIILTNMSLDTGSQLFHKKLLSSPRKRTRQDSGSAALDPTEAVADLEALLEGLVDRLAMWQIIATLGNEITSLFPDRKPSVSESQVETGDELHDLDDVQRFWTDVVEEHYTSQLPLLNPSFRPKLFPTSIYDPSSSSSLMPTQFDATARAQHPDLSSVHRTPNLKKLERRALKRASRAESAARCNVSPTMRELGGHGRKPLSKRASLSESQLRLRPQQLSASSRALFSRRQVSMPRVPSKSKLAIQRVASASTVSFNNSQPSRGVWGQQNIRMPGKLQIGCKRKQSSPKKIVNQHGPNRTELLATPRKSIKLSGSMANSGVLVPDTPQAHHHQ